LSFRPLTPTADSAPPVPQERFSDAFREHITHRDGDLCSDETRLGASIPSQKKRP